MFEHLPNGTLWGTKITVANFSPVFAGKSALQLHVYDDDHNELYQKFELVPSLKKGETFTFCFLVKAGDITRHPVLVIDLDCNNEVAESNEHNNHVVLPIK